MVVFLRCYIYGPKLGVSAVSLEKTTHSMQHIAIYGKDLSMNSSFMSGVLKGNSPEYFPFLLGKKGVLFSNVTLKKFVEEEWKHDRYDLSFTEKRSIRTFSSGEQKKALLNYLLAKNPDFIVLDNPFDALDVSSRQLLQDKVAALSRSINIIQVFKRRDELLPFIKHALYTEKDMVIFSGSVDEYLKRYGEVQNFVLNGSIPPPSKHFVDVPRELIVLNEVSVRFNNKRVLDAITWRVEKGEFWELTGPNGSGKTTLLTMITGDNPKAFGKDLYLFGRKKGSGESVWDIKEKIGYFTASMMDLFSRRHTVEQMIISGMVDSIGLYKRANTYQLELAKQWMKLTGIEQEAGRPFVELSQVHQRMVLIIRAMVKHPPVLILDEPSNGLDDKGALILTTLINKMAAESNTAIIYVSHRKEPGLKPHKLFELTPSEHGSKGKLVSK